MDQISQILDAALRQDLARRLIITAAIVIGGAVLRRVTLALIWRRVSDVRLRFRWRRFVGYTTTIVGALILGWIWVPAFGAIATFFGLLSAGLAIALRDMIADFAAWLFITWRGPFRVGDRIQIGPHAGDVIDQSAFQFTILEIGNWVAADQSTGRIIHVPNGKIFTEPLANYAQALEYIWNELTVRVTFESNWRKAKSILGEVVHRHGDVPDEEAEKQILGSVRRFMIHYSTLQPIVYTSADENGVRLTIRYLCEPRRRRGSEARIWEDILDEFAKHDDIVFAYETRRNIEHRAGPTLAHRVAAAADATGAET